MTILESLQWANNKLKKSGIDSPMLDAEILLAHVLDVSRAKLFSRFNDPLKQHNEEQFTSLVERRTMHEPIAYLLGKKHFFGREFIVNPFVLIPRPATETLVESAIDFFHTLNETDHVLFTDIGTGSGAIAVTIALETQTPVIAIDTSRRALSVAKKNAQQYNAGELIDFRAGDLLSPLLSLFETIRTASQKPVSSVYPFKHLIICANLPYLTKHQMETLEPDVRLYEPHEALEAGPDGLETYWRLFRQLNKERTRLPHHVAIFIEIDPTQATHAVQLIQHQFPHTTPKIKKDLSGLDRVVIVENL